MVDIPDELRCVFSASIRERDGSYVIELPATEIEHGTLTRGETYRVAVFGSSTGSSATPHAASQSTPSQAAGERGLPEPPVAEGEVREVTIETVGDQGDGIAKVERGYVVIVPGTHPGEQPVVEIEDVQANVAFASVVDRESRTP